MEIANRNAPIQTVKFMFAGANVKRIASLLVLVIRLCNPFDTSCHIAAVSNNLELFRAVFFQKGDWNTHFASIITRYVRHLAYFDCVIVHIARVHIWVIRLEQVERLVALCEKRGCALSVTGDYEITPVTLSPVRPNVTLRQAGLFRTRSVAGMAYPDFYQSTAFALCDHEFCILHGPDSDKARDLLLATGDYELPDASTFQPFNSSTLQPTRTILLAKRGGWCEYKWWTDNREAPDFASHVDIHNKPGYDPAELFLFCRGTVRGTHGRPCEVAFAAT